MGIHQHCWSLKLKENADVEFGRLQARDMLQHLWTGPYSNAAVDIIQGSKSVEVRPVGVTKVGYITWSRSAFTLQWTPSLEVIHIKKVEKTNKASPSLRIIKARDWDHWHRDSCSKPVNVSASLFVHYWCLLFLLMQGATMGSNLIRIAESKGPDFKIDYLLCIGHFLSKVNAPTLFLRSFKNFL